MPTLGEDVWVKRDDQSGAGYGGNKVRKLEFLLGDARARGRRALLTIGGDGSNHILATALYAQKAGFEATHAVTFPQPPSAEVEAKQAAYRALDVRLSNTAGKAIVPFAVVGRLAASIARRHGWPYFIPPGGSSAMGTLGYVSAGLELAAQIASNELPEPHQIYVPLGSGGTVAGLLVGLRLAGLRARVVAVQVVPAPWISLGAVISLAKKTARLLARHGVEVPGSFSVEDLDLCKDQLGPGYGMTTPAASEAVARAASAGLKLDGTYSGKAMAALLAAPRQGPVLFWLTYSEPANP